MIQRAPRWFRRLFVDTSAEIEEARKLRRQAEQVLDRITADLNDTEEYWRFAHDNIEGLTCGIAERKNDTPEDI
jgi:hypothetical protein